MMNDPSLPLLNDGDSSANGHGKPHRSIEIQFFTIGPYRIRVGRWRRDGSGANSPIPILIFGGIGQNLEAICDVADQMQDFDLVTLDMPGIGGSPPSRFPYRFSHMASVAREIIERLGYDQVDVFGVSWGGALAQQFAYSFPSCCRRLVLAATTTGLIMHWGKLSAYVNISKPRRYYDPEFARQTAGDLYGGIYRSRPELASFHLRRATKPSKKGILFQLLAAFRWTSILWLGKLVQPTLILYGLDDPLAPPTNAKLQNKLIPNSRVMPLNCGHLFCLTHPAVCAEAVRQFVTGASNGLPVAPQSPSSAGYAP
jgi:poly(3-hydroxyalkanoate) depolymerase